MTKAKRLECKRKFLSRVVKILIANSRFDNIQFSIPRRTSDRNPKLDEFVTVFLFSEGIRTEVVWHIREITAEEKTVNYRKANLIRIKLDMALEDLEDIAICEARKDEPSIPYEQVRQELGLDDEKEQDA